MAGCCGVDRLLQAGLKRFKLMIYQIFTNMKKMIMLVAAILFGITATFAQAWTINVSWEADECDNCSDGYFEVIYTIYDNYNQVAIYTNEKVTDIDLTEDEVNIPVPLVEDNCDLLSETWRPNYQILVRVKLFCKDGSFEYEVICSGQSSTEKMCSDFSSGTVPLFVDLNPVD